MLQVVTLEKLWLLLATVTVGILAIVDLAETSGQEKVVVGRSKLGSNALHRRAPPGPGISIQCGDSINVPTSQAKMPPKSVGKYPYPNDLQLINRLTAFNNLKYPHN
jgi:hypothetical protein